MTYHPKQPKPEQIQEILADIAMLNQRFPLAFPKRGQGIVRPLSIRINREILSASKTQGLGLTGRRVRNLLSFWCSRTHYLRSFRSASGRINLQGEIVGEVGGPHRAYAQDRLERRWRDSIPNKIQGLNDPVEAGSGDAPPS